MLKLYNNLIKLYIEGGRCPDNLGLKTAHSLGCVKCREQAIKNFINVELFEKLKTEYIENAFGVCPHELDENYVNIESEKCDITCEACRKEAIISILERNENNEC